ncbi:MAG: flagellar basal body rod protein FlgC [Parvularculaceae bacterium]|nr:flagellar basal body rod protein FlgC [Parvularculaceae bacterium]
MNLFAKTSATIASGLRAQAYRLQLSSENLANADTHGYRRKLVSFDGVRDRITGASLVRVSRVSLDPTKAEEVYDPQHPFADENGYVAKSNVNMILELADAREATRSYEAGLQLFRQAREMYAGLLEVLKR